MCFQILGLTVNIKEIKKPHPTPLGARCGMGGLLLYLQIQLKLLWRQADAIHLIVEGGSHKVER